MSEDCAQKRYDFLDRKQQRFRGGVFWLKASVTGIIGPAVFVNYTHAFPLQVREVVMNLTVAD